MGNSLRCCLACILPCGALDLIRIVHLNGYVEEITRPITAGEVLKENPNHVLSKPCSQGMARRILILSPESELKRGSIYFLIPASSLPEKKKSRSHFSKESSKKSKKCSNIDIISTMDECGVISTTTDDCDHQHLKKATSEKKSSRRRERRRSSSGVWKPHLESITEDQ